MGRPTLPDPIERRNLLWAEQKRPVDHASLCERYLAHERKSDALAFIEKVADPAKREALRARVLADAVAQGDAFLLARLDSSGTVDEASWRAAMENAKKNGKLRYALKIARRIGDQAVIAELDPVINPAPPPVALPAGIPPELLAALMAARGAAPPAGAPAGAPPPPPSSDGGEAPPAPTT